MSISFAAPLSPLQVVHIVATFLWGHAVHTATDVGFEARLALDAAMHPVRIELQDTLAPFDRGGGWGCGVGTEPSHLIKP